MTSADEVAYLQRLLDEGGVSDAALAYLAATLFTARAIDRAMRTSPLQIQSLLDEAMGEYRALSPKPRAAVIEGLHAAFGLDRCLKQLAYLGHRLPGVEWPARIEKLGPHPALRWQGREVYRGAPHVVRDIYDVLTGAKGMNEGERRNIWVLLGAEGTGELALVREDGTLVESEVVTARRRPAPDHDPDPSPVSEP